MGVADPIDRVDHARGTDQRIAPSQHRRRSGMRLLTSDSHLVPALTLCADPRGFEDKPLLDMCLEIGGDRAATDRLGPGKADPRKLGAEGHAGQVVGPCQTLGKIEDAGEDSLAHHRRREA
jgi:hypothetical protein